MSRRTSRERGKSKIDGSASWATLADGVRMGMLRLVGDNSSLVAKMLQKEDTSASTLAEACAGVMAQQQLNPEAFLARFFNAEMLSHHAELLGKSGKGNESVLAARIAKEWQRGGFRVAASGEAASGDVSNTAASGDVSNTAAGDVSNTAAAQETPQKKRKVTGEVRSAVNGQVTSAQPPSLTSVEAPEAPSLTSLSDSFTSPQPASSVSPQATTASGLKRDFRSPQAASNAIQEPKAHESESGKCKTRVRHLVLMKFKADTEVAELTRAKEQLLSLKDKVPGIINITFGHTFTHDRAQGYTHALVVDLTDTAALEAYASHAEHQAVVRDHLKPNFDAPPLAIDYLY